MAQTPTPNAATSAGVEASVDASLDRALERPMGGVRVVDLSQGIAGPYAAKWLAGLGADVVKVEPPAGDLARRAGPWPDDIPNDETSGLYLYLNSNKRGLTLNLDTSDGRAICAQLIDRAEIVIESFPPGYLEERGLAYESLRERNPGLVLVSVTPFGQSGPYAHLPATELTLYALSGQMGITGDPNREPLKNGGSQPSYQAGLHAFTATQVAYFGALQHGRGTHLDISAQETFASMLELYASYSSQLGEEYRGRMGNMINAIWGIYPCLDGHAGMCILPRNYDRMAVATGIAELQEPPLNDPLLRLELDDMLQAIMYGWFGGKTRKEVHAVALEHSFPGGYVATIEDLVESEQFQVRDYLQHDDHPLAGPLDFPAHLWIATEHGWDRGRAPTLGQHNQEVLVDELGYDADDLARLRELDAI